MCAFIHSIVSIFKGACNNKYEVMGKRLHCSLILLGVIWFSVQFLNDHFTHMLLF